MGEENLQLEGTSLDSMMECLTLLHWQAYGQPSGEQIAFWKLLEQDGGRGGGPSHVLRVLPQLSGSASALQGAAFLEASDEARKFSRLTSKAIAVVLTLGPASSDLAARRMRNRPRHHWPC